MNDERVVEEIVTTFLLNSCKLRPQLSEHIADAAIHCALTAYFSPSFADDAYGDMAMIPLTTGSVAEFYIEPMLPHIGDIDVMYYQSNELAIPRGHLPPTQLPAEFHNFVDVYEIDDSGFSGYVYLRLCYLLTECFHDGKYNAANYKGYLMGIPKSSLMHGPAWVCTTIGHSLLCDNVFCLRCLVWPPQAADWPRRHRNYSWPDSATVDHVVNNGCDVVRMAHRQCRQDEWMNKAQWRISFSRAEIVLINSWMPLQQIVYHLLRVFMKTERLTDSANNTVTGSLSNYHIKTLMLWASELKSRTWWTGDLNLVRICVQLLHSLGDWLTDARCQHYFINNCNLIDNSVNVTNIGGQLMSIDATWLSMWFVDNYIRQCSKLCADNISRLFDDVSTTIKLQKAVNAIVVWRLNSTLLDLRHALNWTEYYIKQYVYKVSLTARSCSC